jgi:hypothetical protein
MARYHPATLTDQGDFSHIASIVLLEPEHWVGKPFPLIRQIDIGDQLMTGHWLVILYRYDCPVCQREVPKYEKMARRNRVRGDGPNIALVEMPPYAPPDQSMVVSPSAAVFGKLSNAKEWFVTTPVRMEIQNGLVVQASEGQTPVGE